MRAKQSKNILYKKQDLDRKRKKKKKIKRVLYMMKGKPGVKVFLTKNKIMKEIYMCVLKGYSLKGYHK